MERGRIYGLRVSEVATRPSFFRRAFHLASPFFLVYYTVPSDIGIGIPKQYVLISILSGLIIIEIMRIAFSVRLFGMREYEARKLSAYAWGAIGLSLGFLFFPMKFVVPLFVGMAWVDPLCNWARQRNVYPTIPMLAYFGIVLMLMTTMSGVDRSTLAAYSFIATVLALAAEYPNNRYIDDDFTMFVVPLVAISTLDFLL